MKNGKIIDRWGVRWYKNDKLHRKEGPAFIGVSGRIEWRFEGLYHRVGMPAVYRQDGTKEYHYMGEVINESLNNKIRNVLTCDLELLPLLINSEIRALREVSRGRLKCVWCGYSYEFKTVIKELSSGLLEIL